MYTLSIDILTVTAIFAAAFLTLRSSALPTKLTTRDDGSTIANGTSVKELAKSAILAFIASKDAASIGFTIIPGWQPITWLGDDPLGNQTLFDTFDQVTGPNGTVHYADAYKTFVQNMNKGSKGTGTNKALEEAQNTQTKACDTLRSKILNQALDAYRESVDGGPVSDIHNSDFLGWASTKYAPYEIANAKCMAAENDFNSEYDKLNGNNFALFNQASENIRNIMDEVPHEGFNMPVGQPSHTSGKASTYLPLYSIYGLPGIVNGWKNSSPDSEPAWSFNSDTQKFENNSKTTWGGGGVGISWGRSSISASADETTTDAVLDSSATNLTMIFLGMTIVDITLGNWQDNWRTAEAIKNASPDDKITAEAKTAFKNSFNTPEAPGPAAVYSYKAVVAYGVSFSLDFSDATTATHFQKVSASGKICFLFICGGGSGGSETNNTKVELTNSSIHAADKTGQAYVVAIGKRNFWDGAIQDSNSDGGAVTA